MSTDREQGRERDIVPIRGHHRFDDLGGIDSAQDTIEHDHRNRDDGDAENDSQPVPTDFLVAEQCGPVQRVEHGALAVLGSGLHRSVRHAISGNFRIHPTYRRGDGRCPIPALRPPLARAFSEPIGND